MESTDKPCTPPPTRCSGVHVTLRLLLFAASLTAVVLMVSSKQTAPVAVPGLPFTVNIAAKFNHSPAFIYFVVALSVACLYSIITTLASLSALMSKSTSLKYLFLFAVWDVLLLGMVASATGAAGGVGYIGLKGNEHVSWNKVCNVYDKFCKHVGSSIAMSLFAAILLVVLSMLSTYSLYKRVHD